MAKKLLLKHRMNLKPVRASDQAYAESSAMPADEMTTASGEINPSVDEPNDWTQLYEEGRELCHEGRYLEAVARYRQAEKLNPGFSGIPLHLGGTLYHAGRYNEAIATLQSARDRFPDDADILESLIVATEGLAEILRNTGNDTGANQLYKDTCILYRELLGRLL
ncbi:MAG: tetratricopeptide repeat protein [Nanoarchaeota archaeon]|nr:tetratricopeptide repeat protein [Nanoarchaeota archaeon]MBU1704919.1 tetratricopeptide repeat protein [Nanoarchaeota archaeon]